MVTINILTLFPDLIKTHLEILPFKKAIATKKLAVNLINIRDYATDKYKTVDDKPYGGGTGMILKLQPIYDALMSLNLAKDPKNKIVLLSPRGKTYTQKMARNYSKLKTLTLICGRYEGVDHRIRHFVSEEISIGDYILSGGELAALVLAESVTRLLPGVLEKADATTNESFSQDFLEHPQYTRPDVFLGHKVPAVLLSGDHQKILEWKSKNSKKLISKN